MQRLDLPRVDDGLAVEAELLDEHCLGEEALLVVDVGIDGVQRGDPGGAGRIQDHAPGKQQLDAVRAGRLQIGDVVLRTESDADETVAGAGDLGRIQNAVCALNSCHHAGRADGDAGLALDAGDLALTVDHVLCGVGLRQADDLHTGAHDGLEVLDAEAARKIVDTDDGLMRAKIQGAQRIVDEQTRGVLLRVGHGVLEVEHDAVRAIDVRVADHAGVIAGNEHHTAAQSVFDIHHLTSQRYAAEPALRNSAAVTRARMVQSSAPLSTAVTAAFSTPYSVSVSVMTLRICAPNCCRTLLVRSI